MTLKRNDPKPKPVEEWGIEEWEAAYTLKVKEINELKDAMRCALKQLAKAVT